MPYIRLTDLHSYKTADGLGETVWKIVLRWEWFARKTIGAQLVEAVDSIAANIAEGFGRYHKKDKMKFYHYALGSRSETEAWIRKACARQLVTPEEGDALLQQLEQLRIEIWTLIKITRTKLTI